MSELLRRTVFTRFNFIFLAIVFVYGVCVWSTTRIYDAPAYFTTSFYSKPMWVSTAAFVVFFVIWRMLYIMIVRRPRRLTREILLDIKGLFTAERILTALPLLIMI